MLQSMRRFATKTKDYKFTRSYRAMRCHRASNRTLHGRHGRSKERLWWRSGVRTVRQPCLVLLATFQVPGAARRFKKQKNPEANQRQRGLPWWYPTEHDTKVLQGSVKGPVRRYGMPRNLCGRRVQPRQGPCCCTDKVGVKKVVGYEVDENTAAMAREFETVRRSRGSELFGRARTRHFARRRHAPHYDELWLSLSLQFHLLKLFCRSKLRRVALTIGDNANGRKTCFTTAFTGSPPSRPFELSVAGAHHASVRLACRPGP